MTILPGSLRSWKDLIQNLTTIIVRLYPGEILLDIALILSRGLDMLFPDFLMERVHI